MTENPVGPATGTPVRPATWHYSANEDWRLLYYFNLYRLTMAAVLFLFSHLTLYSVANAKWAGIAPNRFMIVTVLIALSCFGNLYTISLRRPRFNLQANSQILLDIALVSALIYTGDNMQGPIELLLVVSIAAAGVMLSTRMTMFNAAAATLLSLGFTVYSICWHGSELGELRPVGLLGIALFSTGYVLRFASLRIRASEQIAAQHHQEAVDLDRLNDLIVDSMNRGILVIDAHRNIQLANKVVCDHFKLTDHDLRHHLGAAIPQLDIIYSHWRHTGTIRPRTLSAANGELQLAPWFIASGELSLVFLDDTTEERKRVDQAKFAALGRMAAAIAHEVRNPLSAISHASQLLRESPVLQTDDQHMLRIIAEHADRIERVISTVLTLSNQQCHQVDFGLLSWLREFRTTFAQAHALPENAICVCGTDLRVRFDTAHLDQVITNLLVNSIRASPPYQGVPLIEVITRMTAGQSAPSLDIVDAGHGIHEQIRERIFEPFFSDSPRGTGLGLYIARQLCETNEAQLDLVPSVDGARFRITFRPPDHHRAPVI